MNTSYKTRLLRDYSNKRQTSGWEKKNRIRNKRLSRTSYFTWLSCFEAQALGRRRDVEVLLALALPSLSSSESISFSFPAFLPFPFLLFLLSAFFLVFSLPSALQLPVIRFASDTFLLYINSV